MGGMGGGDAKLLAATSVWMGFNIHLIEYLVTSAFVGGLLTMALLSFRGSAMSVFTSRNLFLRHFADEKAGVPYGIALGLGGLLTYPDSPLMVWAVESLIGH
jgi:prepilin peptidase CpaA